MLDVLSGTPSKLWWAAVGESLHPVGDAALSPRPLGLTMSLISRGLSTRPLLMTSSNGSTLSILVLLLHERHQSACQLLHADPICRQLSARRLSPNLPGRRDHGLSYRHPCLKWLCMGNLSLPLLSLKWRSSPRRVCRRDLNPGWLSLYTRCSSRK